MYLVLGGKTRPFLEASVDSVAYDGVFNAFRQMLQYRETWSVSGRIVTDQTVTTTAQAASWMSNAITELRNDLLTMVRPRVTMLNDDLSVSCWDLDPAVCVEGPTIQGIQFPKDGQDIFVTGNNYSFQVVAVKNLVGSNAHGVLEFNESLENTAGGQINGHVGGIINPAEPQIFKQFEPWKYMQSGTAMGQYGYPTIPPPIYPSSLTRPVRRKVYSPEIAYPVPQRFRIDWSYEFESNIALPLVPPHSFYV